MRVIHTGFHARRVATLPKLVTAAAFATGLLAVVSCGGSERTANAPSGTCAAVIQIAKACYDVPASEASCDQVRELFVRTLAERGLGGGEGQNLTKICSNSCELQRRGVSWASMQSKFAEAC